MEAWKQYRAFTVPGPPVFTDKPSSPAPPAENRRRGSSSATSSSRTLSAGSDQDGLPAATHDVEMTVGERSKISQPDKSTYVSFGEDDPSNPKTWSRGYKIFVLMQLSFLTLSVTYASSASSSTESAIMQEFGCNEVVATATTGMFLVGMGFGAMPFAPLSELYGRLPVYIVTILLATLFEIGSALAPSAPALIVLRFLAGVTSSPPLSNAGGTMNDIGTPLSRTLMFPLFATCGFVGPVLSPIIGGYIVTNPAFGWRWCYWVVAIWNAAAFVLVTLFMPETLNPALLKLKALRLRAITGEKHWRAQIEDESLKEATVRALKRPFQMLLVEPVVQFFIFYLTIVYICLYGSFSAYPTIFSSHGLSTSTIGLTFLPVMVGFFVLLAVQILHYKRYLNLSRDAKKGVQRRGIHNGKIEPEERLVPLLGCAIFFPAGLFWLAWTSDPKYSTWLTLMSGLPFGLGLLAIFQGSMQYMMDAYGPFAASALASSTLVRYSVSGLVILAFPRMYHDLGSEWATSIFAFLGVVLTPVPFVFYIYGRRVRSRCEFTVRD